MTTRSAGDGLAPFSDSTIRVLRLADRAISMAPRGDDFRLYAAIRVAMDCLASIDSFYVALIRPGVGMTAFPYTFDHGQALPIEVLPYGPKGLTAWMMASQKTYRYRDDDGAVINRGYMFGDEQETSRDAIVTPLWDADSDIPVTGFMAVLSSEPDTFTDEHARAFEWLASALALARSHRDTEKERLGLAELYPELGGPEMSTTEDLINFVAQELHGLQHSLEVLESSLENSATPGAVIHELTARCSMLLGKFSQFASVAAGPDVLATLTPRERQVAELLARIDGPSNRDIAASLGVKETTAKSHVAAVLRKLGVRQRAEVRWRLAQR
ncbi:helix-turn-helix transcriptional regulator [Humibacillus xanthopallidus]|uniref:Regulatory LuxR family protein n=1 Tax=Humibacillus xanthopallidus TaxID=412689 RepID=A0A543HZJ5_9MICO|nr:helix-turn-helix transcriptional regulator [Humibacillus xanthopallidus]TQM63738.1 regulatory LuxR family protein [Humibacillus xanthopallidus]